MTNSFEEVRIVEGGDLFVLIDEDAKEFIITDLETANTLVDFEMTNKWVQDAEDIYIQDLTSWVDEMIDMFGYTEIEED